MSEQVIGRFVKVLRGAEVPVSPAETLDAVQVTALLGYQDRAALKQGLSLVLAKTEHDKLAFDECFDDFFRSLVSRYPGYREHAFNCVGSVAHAFRYVLAEVAVKWGMRMGRIVASPIEALTAFHRNIYSPTIL